MCSYSFSACSVSVYVFNENMNEMKEPYNVSSFIIRMNVEVKYK